MPARLEVIVGPMFAGKTEELIRRLKRERFAKRTVQVIKPYFDDRTQDFIASRAIGEDGRVHIVEKIPALVVHNSQEMDDALRGISVPLADTIAIDEGQFGDDSLPLMIGQDLRERKAEDHIVIVSGLDLDYAMHPYGPMPPIMALADEVTKLTAICMKCHARGARFTQRLRGTTEQNQTGDFGDYEVRCIGCHYVFGEEQPPSL